MVLSITRAIDNQQFIVRENVSKNTNKLIVERIQEATLFIESFVGRLCFFGKVCSRELLSVIVLTSLLSVLYFSGNSIVKTNRYVCPG